MNLNTFLPAEWAEQDAVLLAWRWRLLLFQAGSQELALFAKGSPR